jgi:acylphosphatase
MIRYIASMICRKYFVAGRVQGVYYRATAARHARELQIKGYARNLADGRVEVLAYGSEAAHEELVKRLWIGSSASEVTSVEATDLADVTEIPSHFSTG